GFESGRERDVPAGDLPRVNEGLRELQEPGSISREGRTAASAIQELSLKDILKGLDPYRDSGVRYMQPLCGRRHVSGRHHLHKGSSEVDIHESPPCVTAAWRCDGLAPRHACGGPSSKPTGMEHNVLRCQHKPFENSVVFDRSRVGC